MKRNFTLLALVLSFLTGCAKESASIGVIGGADGPTAIMVSGPNLSTDGMMSNIPLGAIAFGIILIFVVVIMFVANKKD